MRFDDEDWRVTKARSVPTSEINLQDVEFWKDERILNEFHHNNYGRPWVLGKYQFDQMLHRGLLPEHKVLDFGCGAGRLGTHLVRYLNPSCYFGIDSNSKSAETFSYEMFLHGLLDKKPRFVLDSSFCLGVFGESFDFVMDFYTTKHMAQEAQEKVLVEISKVLASGGRLMVAPEPRVDKERIDALGLKLCHSEIQPCRFLEFSKYNSEITWFEYVLDTESSV